MLGRGEAVALHLLLTPKKGTRTSNFQSNKPPPISCVKGNEDVKKGRGGGSYPPSLWTFKRELQLHVSDQMSLF